MNTEEILDVIDNFVSSQYQVGVIFRDEISAVFSYGMGSYSNNVIHRGNLLHTQKGNVSVKEALSELKRVKTEVDFRPNDLIAKIGYSEDKDPEVIRLQKMLAKFGTKAELIVSLYSSSENTKEFFIYVKDNEKEAKNYRGAITSRKTGIIENFSRMKVNSYSQFLLENASYSPNDIWIVCEVYPDEIKSIHLDKKGAEVEFEKMEEEWKKFYSKSIKHVTKNETPPAPQKYAVYTLAQAIDHIKDRVHDEYASQDPSY